MTRRILPILFASLCATQAAAGCFGTGTPMFHCTFNGGARAVNVCLQGEVVVYSFGKTGQAPDMLMGRREIGVHMTPWNGVGRSIFEEVTFYNSTYSYTLSYAIERSDDSQPIDGRLIVGEGDSEVAELICDKGSVTTADFYPLYEAKEAAGQIYCRETFSWGSGC